MFELLFFFSGGCYSLRLALCGVGCLFHLFLKIFSNFSQTLCSLCPMKEGSSDKKFLGQSCSYLHMTMMIKLLESNCQRPEECWCTGGPCLDLLESSQKHKEINVWSQKLYLRRQGLLSFATEAQHRLRNQSWDCSRNSSKPLPWAGHFAGRWLLLRWML